MKYIRKLKYYIAAIVVMAVPFSVVQQAAAYSGSGAGTAGSPYVITSCAQFAQINDELDAHYTLAQDIDCSGDGDAIKVTAGDFTGVLDGGGHTLTMQLTVESGAWGELALFGMLSGEVHNIRLAGSVTSDEDDGDGATAALVAYSYQGTFSNIFSTVAVSDVGDIAGGLIGTLLS